MNIPRVEVEIKASRTCFLTRQLEFHIVLYLTLRGSVKRMTFLKDGFDGVAGLLQLNSDQLLQCVDAESGEQVHIFRRGTQPSFIELGPDERAYIQFTTSSAPGPDELPLDPTSLRPGRKYSIRLEKKASVAHWSVSAEWLLNRVSEVPNSSLTTKDIPEPSGVRVLWDGIGNESVIVFDTRLAPPKSRKVSVSLSAPSMYSFSGRQPFEYTLTFSTDSPSPITVLGKRGDVQDFESDIAIIDPASNARIAPYILDVDDERPLQREDFLRIEGTYTEHRRMDPSSPKWEGLEELMVGEEYIPFVGRDVVVLD
ncbi:hypothetical protein CC86DRAFT_404068 [Ophiobolus disseminans]|uniref:Uncharacterized protein n=1 Tax=Ophiobolus disseminans TaxID=1469910 RepID=A0A6A7A9T4_9PLEO|nr:hypothetical protein CC86DRAFT_404068 [Ophiobolus disseminans]